MNFAGKSYWLVGASEGLGRSLAIKLAQEGARLTLSARNEKRLKELAKQVPNDPTILPLDVTDRKAVKSAQSKIGNLDGVIYAAGVYWPMDTSDWNQEDVETMIDINFAGAARIVGPVAREFAKRDHGHIVMIGSLAGFRGLKGAIGYGSSKGGMMHLAEDIHADLVRTNVKVQLINPGFIKTRLTDKNDFKMPFLMTPDQAADQVMKAMKSKRFQSNFPRIFSWVFRGANFLPAAIYYRIFGAKPN